VGCVLLAHFSPTIGARVNLGLFGVQLFFVLSGFLITGLLLDARGRIRAGRTTLSAEWRAFLMRRTLRIFPLYYGVILLGLACNVEGVRANAGWLLTYTYNFRIWRAGGWPDPLLAHFWSLAVEEQFYLIWPWLVLCAPRRLLPWIMLTLLPAAVAFRFACRHGSLGPPIGQEVLLPACWDLLAAGALMAWARHSGWSASARHRLILQVLFVIGLAGFVRNVSLTPEALEGYWFGRLDFTCDALFFAVLVQICACNRIRWLRWILGWPALLYLGRISYGIYVFHNFMHYLGPGLSRHLFGVRYFPHEWAHVLWLSACSVAAAAVSYHFYERPWQGLKRRWSPSAISKNPPFKLAGAPGGSIR